MSVLAIRRNRVETREHPRLVDHLIMLRGVVKVYATNNQPLAVLKGIDLSINHGEFVAVTGKSGSGKSTLINMITGIDRPTEGQVHVQGTVLNQLNEARLARWRGENVGVVFQFFQLLPTLTVLHNVMLPMDFCNSYPRRQRKERALALLDLVEMAGHADKYPSELSGGQQQRVAIARALANNPAIVIADEPTGNLDSRTAESVFELFERLVAEGKTIFMVTHDSELARRATRQIVITDGAITSDSAHLN